jgi:hypothetical protein
MSLEPLPTNNGVDLLAEQGDAITDEVFELYLEGQSLNKIAATMPGVSRQRIGRLIKQRFELLHSTPVAKVEEARKDAVQRIEHIQRRAWRAFNKHEDEKPQVAARYLDILLRGEELRARLEIGLAAAQQPDPTGQPAGPQVRWVVIRNRADGDSDVAIGETVGVLPES